MRAPSRGGRGARGRRRGDGRVARRGRARSPCPTTTSSGSTSSRRATRATSAGTSRRPTPDEYPLLLHFPYFDLYRKQVVKQADLVLAMVACRRSLHAREEKARAFAYYEPLTVRDSSLSACVQAIMAAEVGHLELAFDYFGEAALMDLDDLEHNTRDGLHMASLAGSWLAAVAGFGGFRDHEGRLLLRPAAAAAPRAPGLRAHAARAPAAGGDRAGRGALRAASTASRSSCATMTRRSRSSAGSPQAHPWRAPERRRAARAAPASRAHPAPPARLRLTSGAVLRWIDRGLPPPQARRKTLPGPRLRGVFSSARDPRMH